jgi:hypothetical protein
LEVNQDKSPKKKFSGLVISYNTAELTAKCIQSIYKFCPDLFEEIIVVDNASKDNTIELLSQFEKVIIHRNDKNYGFSNAVNKGISLANNEFVVVFNSDTELFDTSLYNLLEVANENLGIASPQLVYPNGSWQLSYYWQPSIKYAIYDLFIITFLFKRYESWKLNKPFLKSTKEVEYCDGALFMINKLNFHKIGGFDESYFFFSEETQFAYDARKLGYKVLHVPKAIVKHIRGASSESTYHRDWLLSLSKAFFIQKNYGVKHTYSFLKLQLLHFRMLKIAKGIFNLYNEHYINQIKIHKELIGNLKRDGKIKTN